MTSDPDVTSEPAPRPRRKARRSRALLVVVLLLLCLGVAEAGLRLTGADGFRRPVGELSAAKRKEMIFQESGVPGLAYELVPDLRDVRPAGIDAVVETNSLGMRDDEPLPRDVPTTRIVALGDSFTFGYGVESAYTWPSRLEQFLDEERAAGEVFEVLNLGVGGYSSRDEALVLQHKGLALDPDLVVIGYALNDPDIEPVGPLHEYFREPEWWQHSALLRKGAEWQHSRLVEQVGGGDPLRWAHANPETWSTVERAFADMAAACADADVPVLLLIFPVNFGTHWKSYRYRNVHWQVAAAAEAAGFAVIDMLPVFGKHDALVMRVSEEDGHPSRSAHRLTARTIIQWMTDERDRWQR